jgi:hypothetical protein
MMDLEGRRKLPPLRGVSQRIYDSTWNTPEFCRGMEGGPSVYQIKREISKRCAASSELETNETALRRNDAPVGMLFIISEMMSPIGMVQTEMKSQRIKSVRHEKRRKREPAQPPHK